jgi:hypothetical protein
MSQPTRQPSVSPVGFHTTAFEPLDDLFNEPWPVDANGSIVAPEMSPDQLPAFMPDFNVNGAVMLPEQQQEFSWTPQDERYLADLQEMNTFLPAEQQQMQGGFVSDSFAPAMYLPSEPPIMTMSTPTNMATGQLNPSHNVNASWSQPQTGYRLAPEPQQEVNSYLAAPPVMPVEPTPKPTSKAMGKRKRSNDDASIPSTASKRKGKQPQLKPAAAPMVMPQEQPQHHQKVQLVHLREKTAAARLASQQPAPTAPAQQPQRPSLTPQDEKMFEMTRWKIQMQKVMHASFEDKLVAEKEKMEAKLRAEIEVKLRVEMEKQLQDRELKMMEHLEKVLRPIIAKELRPEIRKEVENEIYGFTPGPEVPETIETRISASV